MNINIIYRHYIALICIACSLMITSCSSDEWTAASNNQTNEQSDDKRPQIAHEVSVSLDGANTRVSYQKEDGDTETPGLNLSWNASETLGVYIRKTDNSIIYAGYITSTGTQGDTGERKFSGSVSEKQDGEQYIYIHPAPTGETQGNAAAAKINFNSQEDALGSTTHLANYIPLIWNEGSPIVSNQGYAVHLTLTFDEDPGTITKVSLQTMPNVGNYHIFPATFDASTMSASSTMENELTLKVTSPGTATNNSNGKWTAEAYLACTHRDINVFRTKFNVKVTAANGIYYNEFRSFPGQQEATANTGLPMLANGKCYNLTTPMSKGAATTIINSQYKVNSLLGLWNLYGKTTDPFGMLKTDTDVPSQLKTNILDKKTAFTARTLVNKSSQGSPTFTWTMVTKQCEGSYKQDNVTYNNIEIVGAPTEVYVTFISEYAWSQNLLGYYHYSGTAPTSPSEVLKTIIFPNVSKGGHVPYNKGGVDGGANINPNTDKANVGTASDAPLQEYTTVQLLYNNPDGTVSKEFPVGTTIGFFMMRDPKASSSGHDEGTAGGTGDIDHTGYQPRTDNTLIDWNAWRLFTNTAWNSAKNPYTSQYNNTGWWDMNCHNFFCSADVGNATNGGVIPGLALYGAKDDASHNYNYSFSAMLYMVSTSNPSSMKTANKAYFNLGTGAQIIDITK